MKFYFGTIRWHLLKIMGGFLVLLVAAWMALGYFLPAPPSTIVIASGFKGGAYEFFAQRYQLKFGAAKVATEIRLTNGSIDNLQQLQDPKSGVQAAFVQGGVSNAAQTPGLVSLGRINHQVFWIFHRTQDRFDSLSQLKGKRIAIGPDGSGTQAVARQVLGINGISTITATMLPLAAEEAVTALRAGKADVIFLAFAADAPIIRDLLHDEAVKLMNVKVADALTRRFPFLVKLVLPQGVIDFERNIPTQDIHLIGTTNALLVREDLHPETVQLLAKTLVDVHGGNGLFQKPGEFPSAVDPEYPVAIGAREYYRNGPSFLHRYLPSWATNHAQRAIALLATAAALFFPLFNYLPRLYRWFVRERLNRLYRQLRGVETTLQTEQLTQQQLRELGTKLDAIEANIHPLGVPMRFSDLYFLLKSDIQLVRGVLESRLPQALT